MSKSKKVLIATLSVGVLTAFYNSSVVKADELEAPKTYQQKLDDLKKESEDLKTKKTELENKQKSITTEAVDPKVQEVDQKLKVIKDFKKTIIPLDIEKSKISKKEVTKEDDLKETNELKKLLLEDQLSVVDLSKNVEKKNELESVQKELEETNKKIETNSSEQEKTSKVLEEAKKVEELKNASQSYYAVNAPSNSSPVIPLNNNGSMKSDVPVSIVPNMYPVGECTWGAKELAPWAGTYWGNGGQWAASAASQGYAVGSTPVVGAIAVWTDGGYGHVAVVTAVEGINRIQVRESNYAGNRYIANFRGWFDPTIAQGTVSYIYPPASYQG